MRDKKSSRSNKRDVWPQVSVPTDIIVTPFACFYYPPPQVLHQDANAKLKHSFTHKHARSVTRISEVVALLSVGGGRI